MKDSYSFDRDPDGLDVSYEKHAEAYRRIYDRCGLDWYQVEADVGMMGGNASSEFMAPCSAGEDDVVRAPGYAANLEVASADAQPVELPVAGSAPAEITTPGVKTIEGLAQFVRQHPGTLLKAFPIVLERDDEFLLVMVRGDHSINETKLGNRLGAWRQATPEEIEAELGPPGSLGPVGASIRVVLDTAVEAGGGAYVVGANKPDTHLTDVVPGRDFRFEHHDIRTVLEGDTINGEPVRIERAIEIGNIFKLGTHYSTASRLNATYLDPNGKAQEIWMGCYGLGPARVVAAAVEQFADEQGISWPRTISPFDVHLVTLGKTGSEERDAAEALYAELQDAGLDVIYDDRDAGPGEKFADAELLGCPLRVTVGRKALAAGELEVQIRRGQESRSTPLAGAGAAIKALWSEQP
jgi:prolyl-tRNA synthetase